MRGAAIVFGLGILAHAPCLKQYPNDPFARTLVSDALSYDEWGRRIAAQGLASEPVFHQAPLFPVVLSWFSPSASPETRSADVALLGVVLTSAAAALLVFVGSLFFHSTGAGVVAGLLVLLHGPFVFYSLKTLPLPLTLAGQALVLVALGLAWTRGSRVSAALAGLAIGVAALARTEVLLFAPLALVALTLRPGWRSRAWIAVAFLLGLGMGVAPATIHNLRRGDRVLIASSGGENLYIGNKRGAKGDYTPLHPKAGDLFSERILAREVAEKDLGRALRASEISAYWRRKAMSEIAADFPGWLRLEVGKLGRILDPGDPTDIYSFPLERSRYLTSLHALPLSAWFLLASGGVGIVLALSRMPGRAWPLAAFAGVQALVLLVFFVNTRLRLPFLLSLAPFGGYALVEGGTGWREGRRRPWIAAAAALLVAVGIAGAVLTRPAPRDHVRLASVLSTQNRLDEGLAVLDPVLVTNPEYGPAFDQAGWMLQKKGDFAAARDRYRQAIGGMPEGRVPQTRTRLAMVLEKLGDVTAAAEEHDAAVADPGSDAGAVYERGMFRLRTNRRDDGIRDLQEAARLQPAWDAPQRALAELGRR